MNEITDFVKYSKYAGQRFDLVQAGGGNSSVKLENGQMLIKASGYYLSEVENEKAFVSVSNREITEFVDELSLDSKGDKRGREALASELLRKVCSNDNYKPSIETFLHALLPKYVLHTHPLAVNIVTAHKDYNSILSKLFPEALIIGYETPGIELALLLHEGLNNYHQSKACLPEIIFLKNHGLIVASEHPHRITELTESCVSMIEHSLNLDFSKFKQTSQLSSAINEALEREDLVSFLCQDETINYLIRKSPDLIKVGPFCPDQLVYCGVTCLKLEEFNKRGLIRDFKQKYGDYPKVVLHENQVFFVASNTKKAKEKEEMLRFHLVAVDNIGNDINLLPDEELAYLSNWDAEKYRQEV